MSKPIYVPLAMTKRLRIVSAVVLLLLADRPLRAGAQTLTALWEFSGGSDGVSPYHRLVQGLDGYFYGTTLYGIVFGTGPGTIFRIRGNGGDLTNLWSFTGGVDGAAAKGVTLGSDGRFYGTTYEGGTNGVGSVFRIDGSGGLTNLYSFTDVPDGAHPQAPLVQGNDGVFYGTTWSGGTSGSGSVFRISPSGSYSNLYSFSGPDGANPFAALLQGNDGNFYGTTWNGGTNGDGVKLRSVRVAVIQIFTSSAVPMGPIPLLRWSKATMAICMGRVSTGDERRWHRVSDQFERCLDESLVIHRWGRWERADVGTCPG